MSSCFIVHQIDSREVGLINELGDKYKHMLTDEFYIYI